MLLVGGPSPTYDNQPANTAVFGDYTFFADLSQYYTQISEVRMPGDANLDGGWTSTT